MNILKKIKQLTILLVTLILFVSLFITVSFIWGFIDKETAKDVFLKTLYTSGSIYIVFLFIILVFRNSKK